VEEEEAENVNAAARVPMAVFVHGGVWASGERWQFAPLAHRLAEEGIVTAVISYSLYPEKSAKAQAEEVLKAVKCAIVNAKLFGADASRTHLVGHSAGSHLCAMALLLDEETKEKEESEKLKSFVGMCGVYNIETHYEYEDKRGVAMLSTMGRAMGGKEKFKEMSPYHILEDKISSSSSSSSSTDSSGEDGNINGVAKSFPKTYLFTSDTDIVVPKRESEDFHNTLLKLGVDSELSVYDHGTHGEFALGFKKRPKPLKAFHCDLIELLHS
jgi:acetyl esterase/lipase